MSLRNTLKATERPRVLKAVIDSIIYQDVSEIDNVNRRMLLEDLRSISGAIQYREEGPTLHVTGTYNRATFRIKAI